MRGVAFMKSTKKSLVVLGICTTMAIGTLVGFSGKLLPVTQAYGESSTDVQVVQVSDLVIKFLGVPEYEPNRYTKSSGGKWAPEELEKGLLIKADMKLGEGNPEGMMAPLKHSFADITAIVNAVQATGKITITYNGLTLDMEQGSNTATLNDGTTTKTLTMNGAVTPYFKAIEGEKSEDEGQYYACYLPVKFTAEALGGNVVWNQQMHRMEMGFAFYYTDAAIAPVLNDKGDYTTAGMEGDGNGYSKLAGKLTASGIADMMKAAVTVVDPVYQNADGGWGKTNVKYDLLNDTFTTLCKHAYSTFDNGSTYGQIKFLSRIIRLSKENPTLFVGYETQLSTVETGFWKGVKYMLNAQNALGGWPQYYPYGVGYFKNITLNDNAMQNVMFVISGLTYDSGLATDGAISNLYLDFAWARADIAAQTNPKVTSLGITSAAFQTCWDNALKFIVDAQIKVGNVTTGWSQQYTPTTGKPTGGRAFEIPAITPNESLQVVKVLQNIKNPSPEVRNAIKSYTDWIQTVGFTGYTVVTISDRTRELAKDALLIKDPTATGKLFCRFYGLDTTGEYYGIDAAGKLTTSAFYEVFAGRNGIAQFTMNNGMSERRIGYSYLSGGADTNTKKLYDTWLSVVDK